MNILIYGGSFNPVHVEHVNIAAAAAAALKADKLIVIPTAVSPHKSGMLSVPDESRLEMCRLAFKDIPCAGVSDYEIAQGGISYTYLTVRALKRKYPNDNLIFLVGGDMLASFAQWKNPAEILDCVTLAAAAREDMRTFGEDKKRIEKLFDTHILPVGYVGKPVSSTAVRTLAALGEDVSLYTPPAVSQYIKDHNLYLMPHLLKVKEMLTLQRWQHTVRVAIMCAVNAHRANLTEEQAITMAALHDCAKYLAPDSPYLKGFTMPEGVPEPVIHQFSGAYVAANYFNLTDETLLNAIKYHSSGRENMTAAEMLLYLCDMLEEGRNFPGVDKLRALFKQDLSCCMYAALKHQTQYLKSTKMPVYGLTERAYKYLKGKL